MPKSHRERAIEASERSSHYLAEANEAAERGQKAKAERLYERAQHWLDRHTELTRDGVIKT